MWNLEVLAVYGDTITDKMNIKVYELKNVAIKL